MKIGFLQFQPDLHNKENNLKKIEKFLLGQNLDLIVLPELCNTGYLFRDKEQLYSLAEEIPDGFTCKKIIYLSQKQNCTIVAGIPEKQDQNIYNSALVAASGKYLGKYRKLHLFCNEKELFSAGNEDPVVFEIKNQAKGLSFRLGVMICFDWIFPEFARILALKGAQIIAHPANLILPYAQAAMKTRSLENGVFTITANRIGSEFLEPTGLTFTGGSQIVNPFGQVLYKASRYTQELGFAAIDLNQILEAKQITAYNHLFQDRRVDFYSKILDSSYGH